MSYGYGRITRPSYYGSAYEEDWARGYSGYGVFTSLGSRQVAGSGGYIYQQFSNGDIAILQGTLPSGWRLGSVGPRDAAWSSITAAIGPYPAEAPKDKQEDTRDAWSFVADALTSFGQGAGLIPQTTVTPLASGGATVGPQAAGGTPTGGGTVGDDDKKFPWGWVLGGVGGVTVIGLGIYFATRKKK